MLVSSHHTIGRKTLREKSRFLNKLLPGNKDINQKEESFVTFFKFIWLILFLESQAL